MIPQNLKVGDTFEDDGRKYEVTKVIGDAKNGMYESKLFVGKKPETKPVKEEVEETPTEEEKPVDEPKTEPVEEVKETEEVKEEAPKKAAPKRKPAPKKRTTKR